MNLPLSRMIPVLVATALLGIALWSSAPVQAQPTTEVAITESDPSDAQTWAFTPAEITVTAGTTVLWKNDTGQIHTVTADDDAFDSGDVTPGKNWKHRFDTPGEFTYHCTPHPWMIGTVRVTP